MNVVSRRSFVIDGVNQIGHPIRLQCALVYLPVGVASAISHILIVVGGKTAVGILNFLKLTCIRCAVRKLISAHSSADLRDRVDSTETRSPWRDQGCGIVVKSVALSGAYIVGDGSQF